MKKITVCGMLLCIVVVAKTQATKKIENINQVWLAYFDQARLSNKWGLWFDYNLRTKENFFDNFSVSILRFGLTYYLNTDTRFTAGYAWAEYFPGDNHKNISQPEHRPWQQIQWYTKYGSKKMMQWIRLEERFRHKILNDDALAEGYNFNFRARYNIRYEVPLDKKKLRAGALSFVVNNELHINFGKQIVNNYFDQNRFFAGLKMQLDPTIYVQVGYLNVFQQLAAGNQYKNINAARVFFYQNLDLRRKPQEP